MADLRAIVHRLGGELTDGGMRAHIPGPGHSRKDRSLSLRLLPDGRVHWFSFTGQTWQEVAPYLGLGGDRSDHKPDPKAMEQRRAAEAIRLREITAFCERVWSDTAPGAGSPVETYLHARRGLAEAVPGVLRYHPACPMGYEPKSGRRPAMVALVQGRDGRGVGLHVTALRPDGLDKASGRSRVMFGRPLGGAVRLSPIAPRLAIAEGIETALAYAQMKSVATWAALSTAGLSSFALPAGVEHLAIAADQDDQGAGLKAASDLTSKLRVRCAIETDPAPAGMDWNDALLSLAPAPQIERVA